MRVLGKMQFVLASAFILTSCAGIVAEATEKSDQVVHSKTVSSLLQIDFSEYIEECEFVTFDSPNFKFVGIEKELLETHKKASTDAGADDLTQEDLRRLGIWVTQDGQRMSLMSVQMQLAKYYAHTGHLPDTGVGLFTDLDALGPLEAEQLNHEELFRKYAIGINPITGKFYSSFASEAWTPGGYYIRIVDDEGEIAKRWPDLRVFEVAGDKDSEMIPPATVWEIRLYGENTDSVILETEACVF